MIQIISTVGSLIVLGAYAALQTKRLSSMSLTYSLLNLIGSGIMAAVAIIESQWGILVLKGGWTLISVWTIVKLLTGQPAHAGRREEQ